MRIALVTLFTPTRYNYNAPSALPYQLIKYRNEDDVVKVFSFNYNDVPVDKICEVEEKLGISIETISMPRLINKVRKTILKYYDILMPFHHRGQIKLNLEGRDKIQAFEPDLVWVYTEEIPQVVRQLLQYRIVVSCPDSIAMVYKRMVKVHPYNIKYRLRYKQFYNTERKFLSGDKLMYHLVGEADRSFLKKINPSLNVIYLPHPQNKCVEEKREFTKTGKIKLLIAGRCDVYVRKGVKELLKDVFVEGIGLENLYNITILGSGWDKVVVQLKSIGYAIDYKTYVPNYEEELLKHDVQLVPVSVGSGTKGKVLDALSNGLLVVGTEYALENINVEDGISVIKYANTDELKKVLFDIPLERRQYAEIALRGKKAVDALHAPQKMVDLFWLHVKRFNNGEKV